MNCPICGKPMVHYRMTGYRCWNERHNEMARDMEARIIDGASSGTISQSDFDEWLMGRLPESIQDIRRQYGVEEYLADIPPENRFKMLHQNEWIPPESDE